MLRAPVRVSTVHRHAFSKVALHPKTTRNATNLPRHTMYHPHSAQHIPRLLLTQSSLSRNQVTPLTSTTSTSIALFHSTQRRHAMYLPVLLSVFKVTIPSLKHHSPISILSLSRQVSSTIEFARTAGRIALTFVPLLLFKNRWTRKIIKHHHHLHPGMPPVSEEKKAQLLRCNHSRTWFLYILLFIPTALFWVGIIASAEQAPLTGRCVHFSTCVIAVR